jgi:AcrR family transcriptional regulator
MGEPSTVERILDAAEELFAERGFSTSLRSITADAGVNLAAVNYHFGSKEALIQAVFTRRLEPLNAERLRALDAIEARGLNQDALEPILEAFIGPAIRMSHHPKGETFMRLFGHTLSQRDDRILRLFADRFRAVVERFSEALGRALPHLDGNDLFWRMMFMVGSMAHTMAMSDKMSAVFHDMCRPIDVEQTIGHLVSFVAGGMRADVPVPAPGEQP